MRRMMSYTLPLIDIVELSPFILEINYKSILKAMKEHISVKVY